MDLNPLRILCKFKMQTKYPGDADSESRIICLWHGSQIRASSDSLLLIMIAHKALRLGIKIPRFALNDVGNDLNTIQQ